MKTIHTKVFNLLLDNKLFRSIKDLDVTSGASQDLKQADNLIRNYIQIFGIEEIDNVNFSKIIQSPQTPYNTLSETSKTSIDEYVLYLTNFAIKTATNIIENNIEIFNKLSNDLIIKRSVDINYLNQLNVTYF